METGFFHLLRQVAGYFCFHILGDNTPHQWYAQFRLNAAGVYAGFPVQIFVIDRLPDLFRKRLIMFVIFLLVEQLCGIGQYFSIYIEVYR